MSRFKEELHHGLKVAIIRAMAGSGSVVTSAGRCAPPCSAGESGGLSGVTTPASRRRLEALRSASAPTGSTPASSVHRRRRM
jgi:MMPL family